MRTNREQGSQKGEQGNGAALPPPCPSSVRHRQGLQEAATSADYPFRRS